MTKQKFVVQMDGVATYWATDVYDAMKQARDEFSLWHYAQETGDFEDDKEDEEGDE